ncbi:conserved hypothetical protein [Ricinus communis]|uniref:O-methyltransferase C-terminal domain-containing protein n=1 Tax=Ricinus communis TaxID=3988 RepID=B9RVR1_RICCO|nr:conserved hypothetical protein [Ricinus communis]
MDYAYDWSDEEWLEILKRSKEAIKGKKGGKPIIINMVLENRQVIDYEYIETQHLINVLMMAVQIGKERNSKEWGKLFLRCWFQ